jgi:hypothetical protein
VQVVSSKMKIASTSLESVITSTASSVVGSAATIYFATVVIVAVVVATAVIVSTAASAARAGTIAPPHPHPVLHFALSPPHRTPAAASEGSA